jgi:DNA mismatch repair protein MutS
MSKQRASQTPVMRQYLTAKAAHPDALLFFRMGDFYELFYEDAVTASKALDLTLTARNKGAVDEVPMAGVPHHAVSAYVTRLLAQGFNVAICEQMADPSKVKGIVPREVVRVARPGIAFDDDGIDARQNHYLVALDGAGEGRPPFGLGALDLSTGELMACEADDAPSAIAELVRLAPREVQLAPHLEWLRAQLVAVLPNTPVRIGTEEIDGEQAGAVLDAQFGRSDAASACASVVARRAVARCVSLARASEAGRVLPLSGLAWYSLGDVLLLDEATQGHLELVRSVEGTDRGSLLSAIDLTKTALGARLMRRRLLAPLTGVADIRRRHDAVDLFVAHARMRQEVRDHLAQIGDIERLAVKLALDRTQPRDLVALRRSLKALPALMQSLDEGPHASSREALGVKDGEPWVDACADLLKRLTDALSDEPPPRVSDGGVIRDGYDAELDEARGLQRGGQRHIVDLEIRLREASSIPGAKLRFTRVFGWYIEVSRSQADRAPATWRRKQTVASGERFTCDELDRLADGLAHAEERASVRETQIFADLVHELAAAHERLRAVSARLAEWDVAAALADVAHRDDWSRPEIDESLDLTLEDARHPVVEKLAAAGTFVPNDVHLGAGERGPGARLWLVTGPNMAGKSTLMRQTALCVILAQMGSFVPARRARIGVVDKVLTRVGASDNLSRGESTFMLEMKETANVLRRATARSLVVLDEIGRGTSTYDGLAIAWAVAEHLHDVVACRAMFATHYHELTDLADGRPGTCENWSVSAREHQGDIVFLHKLQRGAASQSYGVACARLAGVPEIVLGRARAILNDLETKGALPGGAPSALRARSRSGKPQLDLFGGAPNAPAGPHPVVETIRNVDVDRLTPLDALKLIADLKKIASAS